MKTRGAGPSLPILGEFVVKRLMECIRAEPRLVATIETDQFSTVGSDPIPRSGAAKSWG